MTTAKLKTAPPARTHATAKVVVQGSRSTPYDRSEGLTLAEVHLIETFSGDIEGRSPIRAMQVLRADRSASLVSVQRFDGTLGGRRGGFVLQGQETVADGRITASWFVVPGSGTGELTGLRGEGGFEGEFGKGSEATLDYWFE